MKLRMIGLDHKSAPIEIRERLAFDRERTAAFLRDWQEAFADFEAVLVSTCNRTELYVATLNGALPPTDELVAFLTRRGEALESTVPNESVPKEVAPKDVAPKESEIPAFFRVYEDAEALEHLFSVAASLESMVLGEPQILAQIKDAYRIAADGGTAGIVTHSAFQAALRAAKTISVETGIFRHRVSIPAIAVVDFALEIFESLTGKKTLVLGAGEMAAETLRYLIDIGAREIAVVNRSREKAEKLAEEAGGVAADWEERFRLLLSADLVVAATGAPEPVISAADYAAIAPKRSGRPLFLLDLSVPRNLDPALEKEPNVYLFTLDDLAEVCARNRKSRDAELPKARKIILRQTEEFLADLKIREQGELIRQLRERWHAAKETELTRLFHKAEFSDAERAEVRYAFDRLVNKMLHGPMESLRDEPDEKPQTLLEAMMKLFRLK